MSLLKFSMKTMKIFLKLLLMQILVSSTKCETNVEKPPDKFLLRIYHLNDILSRFDESCQETVNKSSKFGRSKNCDGGLRRLDAILQANRDDFLATDPDSRKVLLLNGGDSAGTGHLWYSLFRSRLVADFLNIAQFDAITLGEKEFEDGVIGLKQFLKQLDPKIKVLAANLIVDDEPDIKNLNKIQKSAILNMNFKSNNVKICLVGYTYQEADFKGNLGRLQITDEVSAVALETNRLKHTEKCNIIIALGHSSMATDIKIAKKASVDVVISGHTSKYKDTDNSDIEYLIRIPKLVRGTQQEVYIAKTVAYMKSIGSLEFQYIPEDEGFKFNFAQAIYLNQSLEKYKPTAITNQLTSYQNQLRRIQKDIVYTSIRINDSIERCKTGACAFGSLLTDSMVYFIKSAHKKLFNQNIRIDGAIVTANTFKTDYTSRFLTKIKIYELFTSTANIRLVKISGYQLQSIFKQNAIFYLSEDFFQVSKSIKVFYKRKSPNSIRLKTIFIDNIPVFKYNFYRILVNSYLRTGNGGYVELMYSNEINIVPCYEFEAFYQFLSNNISFDLSFCNMTVLSFLTTLMLPDMLNCHWASDFNYFKNILMFADVTLANNVMTYILTFFFVITTSHMCYFLYPKNRKLNFKIIAVLVTSATVLITIQSIYLNETSIKSRLKDIAKDTFHKYYSINNTLSTFFNDFNNYMLKHNCCYIFGPHDFQINVDNLVFEKNQCSNRKFTYGCFRDTLSPGTSWYRFSGFLVFLAFLFLLIQCWCTLSYFGVLENVYKSSNASTFKLKVYDPYSRSSKLATVNKSDQWKSASSSSLSTIASPTFSQTRESVFSVNEHERFGKWQQYKNHRPKFVNGFQYDQHDLGWNTSPDSISSPDSDCSTE